MHPGADPLQRLRQEIDARLERVLDAALADAQNRTPDAVPVVEQVRVLTLRGGKRLRPALVYAATASVTDPDALLEPLIEIGTALELFQSYLLIHDDWMDEDPIRRGGPSVHVALADRFRNARLGEMGAVLAGDFAMALTQERLATEAIPPDRRTPVHRAFATMHRDVVLGQVLDTIDASDHAAILDLKTGSYTVRGPLALGHALGGGNENQWLVLHAYATPLGAAFQLRDDLLGTFGDAARTGKSVSGDLGQGKRTALVRLALERLDARDAAELESLLGASDPPDAADRARALLEKAGVRREIESRIEALRSQAERELAASTVLRPRGIELLTQLSRGIAERHA